MKWLQGLFIDTTDKMLSGLNVSSAVTCDFKLS